jgi:hypothetical protein
VAPVVQKEVFVMWRLLYRRKFLLCSTCCTEGSFCYVAPIIQKEVSGPVTLSCVPFGYHIVIKQN